MEKERGGRWGSSGYKIITQAEVEAEGEAEAEA